MRAHGWISEIIGTQLQIAPQSLNQWHLGSIGQRGYRAGAVNRPQVIQQESLRINYRFGAI
jgi:hypothetical protein